jgi:ADP-ribosylglycohydrolase
MALPNDYRERVYAGVLGKIIGVYVGRPVEGWTYDDIVSRIGEVDYYVNEAVGDYNRREKGLDYRPPIVVTDDDITGTFTFLRALRDNGYDRDISAEKIGKAWLNYIVENRSVFWWGGMGNSTEHTAYLRLKSGLPAPASGSIGTNGRTVAEQIGSQIFIDGWAMVAPGARNTRPSWPAARRASPTTEKPSTAPR